MSDLFPRPLFARLKKLARLFAWRRKARRDTVVEDPTADAQQATLACAHEETLAILQTHNQEHRQLTEHLAAATSELARVREDRLGLQQTLDQTREQSQMRTDILVARHAQLVQKKEDAALALQALEQTLDEARTELKEQASSADTMQQAMARQQDAHQKLATEFNALEQRHGATWTQFQFISRLLAARPTENAGLASFRKLLAQDYIAFTQKDSSLVDATKALLMLQSLEQELALLVGFPCLFERTIVGIVGGFSSGKSEFINSFILDADVRLAVGLQPVTVIPSYVLATDERLIRGYAINGGHIELDMAFYKSISHTFIKSFSFDLKSLMPFMCVGIRMDPEYFSNICFIDTPGYNPPATAAEYSRNDKRTAVQFAQQSDAIIWIIGLDANGTVPASDLEFIQEISLDHGPVYVVLNKADLKSEEDLAFIMDDVASVLEDEQIPFVGISAYSSTQRKVIAFRGSSLMRHFARINRKNDVKKHLEDRLKEIFSMHEDAIQSKIAAFQQQKRGINGFKLDAMEIGGSELYNKMLETIDSLDQKPDIAPLQTWRKESRRLLDDFTKAVHQMTEALEEKTPAMFKNNN